MQQNQERTDIALAELSKQISQLSEAVLEMETTISSDEYLEPILETESMEEVTEDAKLEFLPTPLVMDDQIKCDPIEEEEDVQEEACLTLVSGRIDNLENHAENLIESPGFVGTCTTDFLVIPDYYLSSHVQDHKAGVSFGVEKELRSSGWESWRNGRDTPIKRAGIFEEARSRNRLSIENRSWKRQRIVHGEHKNWKKRKKGKRIIAMPEISIFSVHVQKNRASFGWKPGWNFWKNVSHKVARNARRRIRKFDGMHPWAPNID